MSSESGRIPTRQVSVCKQGQVQSCVARAPFLSQFGTGDSYLARSTVVLSVCQNVGMAKAVALPDLSGQPSLSMARKGCSVFGGSPLTSTEAAGLARSVPF